MYLLCIFTLMEKEVCCVGSDHVVNMMWCLTQDT